MSSSNQSRITTVLGCSLLVFASRYSWADDCNSNGVPDDQDIALGTSQDCNTNSLPDECDVVAGTSPACQPNGVPDECDVLVSDSTCCAEHAEPGCDSPAVESCVCQSDPYCCETRWDRLCVEEVTSLGCGSCINDCNMNGTPDECDLDCNTNGFPDDCDLAAGSSMDCNTNAVPDDCERDFDNDGVIDECDPDIDGDGVPNEEDACDYTPFGAHIVTDPADPLYGSLRGDLDRDCDCDLDDYAILQTEFTGPNPPVFPAPCDDGDGDGVCDSEDGCPDDPDKVDPGICGCGVPDADSDADGVVDCNDVCLGFDDGIDSDGDSVPDGCDACPGFDDAFDYDGDGVPNACDLDIELGYVDPDDGQYVPLGEGDPFPVYVGFQGLVDAYLSFRVTGFEPNAEVELSGVMEWVDPDPDCSEQNNVRPFADIPRTLTAIGPGLNELRDFYRIIRCSPLDVDQVQGRWSLTVTDASGPSVTASIVQTVVLDVQD